MRTLPSGRGSVAPACLPRRDLPHRNLPHRNLPSRDRKGALVLVMLLSALSLSAAPTYKDVSSIFAARCYGCHAAAVKMGSLNLQTWDGFQEGGTHGKIVVPGKSAESRL